MSRFWLIFWRSAVYEAKFLHHNRWDFTMLFWLPFVTIFLIWWIFFRPFITNIPIAVIDNNHSPVSHLLVNYLEASPELTVSQQYSNPEDAYNAILTQQVYGVVIIPNNFSTKINSAQPAPVILKVNAQYGSHSGIVQKGVQTVVGTMSAGVEIKRMIKQGENAKQARMHYSPIAIHRVSLFNAGTNYQQFLASTVLPALLHILSMIIGATTLGRELRDHSLAIWYKCATTNRPYPDFESKKHLAPHAKFLTASNSAHSSNLNTSNLLDPIEDNQSVISNTHVKAETKTKVKFLPLMLALNGKLIWGLLPYTLWGAVILVLAIQSHPTSMVSWLVVYILFLLLMMMSLWLGAIFSLSAYSLRMGLSTTGFISAPSYAFAGVTFPLLAMSNGAQTWANMLPLTPYLKVQIAQLQMSAPPIMAIPYIFGFILAVFACMLVTMLMCKRAFVNPHKWGAR